MEILFDILVRFVEELLGFRKKITLTKSHKEILRLLEKTNRNIFISGKAGTGKSTLIEYFRETTKKNVVVLAPTGLAALNIRGQTVASFFKFPPRIIDRHINLYRKNRRLYRSVDTIVIDEASMLRADVLDGVDRLMRINGRDELLPFGGAQVVLVGDMYQLPPVVTRREAVVYDDLYQTPYFFSARVFREADFIYKELDIVFRQNEKVFIETLNKIRFGDVSPEILNRINSRVRTDARDRNHVVLCPTNKSVNAINSEKLAQINEKEYMYRAVIEGDFPTKDRYLPVAFELHLKKGARVLFVKNDRGGRWVNGTLGTVSEISTDYIRVLIDGQRKPVVVEPAFWENIQYKATDDRVEAEVRGKLFQYPLKLAWAITIHKSQGMSFDKVAIDFSRSPFTTGQTYVALSRCRTLEGIVLTKKIYPNDIMIDERISSFYTSLTS